MTMNDMFTRASFEEEYNPVSERLAKINGYYFDYLKQRETNRRRLE